MAVTGAEMHLDLNVVPHHMLSQSLAIVAVPNGTGMALATAGLIGPITATVLNNGSNIVAALNGLRPLLGRPQRRA